MFGYRRSKPLIRVLETFIAVQLILLISASLVTAATVGPLVLVSGPSPYAGSTIGGGPGAIVYVNAEVEPYVGINPINPKNIIGVWQQDRWNDGGSHGLVAGFSFDGGATWGETTLPFSANAPGGLPYERASDPWVSIGPDETAYAASISFNESNNSNSVAAVISRDGGLTWGNLNVIIADNQPSSQFFNDKESVTADPIHPGVAYVVWDRLESPTANPYAILHAFAFKGPAYFSKTTDGGLTWSSPKVIVDLPMRQQTIANQIVVDAKSGTLYDFFDLFVPPFNISDWKVAFVKSADGGNTWTKPNIIANAQTVAVTDPNTRALIRTGDVIPDVAIDASSGQLYVVWQDARFSGGKYDEVALSTSSDGGATWSAPLRVNTPTGKPAFNPSVNVNSDGTVGVTYYDFRNLAPGNTTTLPTDYWFTSSSNHGVSFGNEAHIAGSFDMLTAPLTLEGYFVGDYEGLASTALTFYPFFIQTNSGSPTNMTDVFSNYVFP